MINKTIFTFVFALLGMLAFSQSLQVTIKQNGKVIQPVDQVYNLKKSPFQIEITAKNIEGFLVGATTDEVLYSAATNGLDFNVEWYQNTGMAEELYNKDKEIFLMDSAPSYWYFTDVNDHRFDRNPKGNSTQWTATRTVNRFYDIMTDRAFPLKNFEGDVFLLFYEPTYNENYNLIDKKDLFQGILTFQD